MTIAELLKSRRPVILDGALGTELERRGISLPSPLWSAAALVSHPEAVRAVHADYVAAGADILVANTFRTNPRALRAAGWLERGPELNCRALEFAREAILAAPSPADSSSGSPLVAASIAPAEDCYSPRLAPEEEVLLAEHRQLVAWLSEASPDLLWIETMGTIREIRAAARAAREAGFPMAASFVLREDGRLLGGESLEDAVAAVEAFDPALLGLNCIPPRGIDAYLPRLRRLTRRPLVAYAHVNNATPTPGWSYAQSASPVEYAEYARRWIDLGAAVVGGCCGTTPKHIRALSQVIDRSRAGK